MPTNTTGLTIQYPAEFDDPFAAVHAAGMEEIDLWLRTAIEDATVALCGGGEMTLATNTFAWTETLYLIASRSNAIVSIAPGSITLLDGHVAWLNGLTRPMVTASLGSISTGAAGPGWDKTKLPLFRRVGSNVFPLHNVIGLERVVTEL